VLAPLPGSGDPPADWELSCRDGWEWRTNGPPGHVAICTTRLSADQALVVQDWLLRNKNPAVWWAVSRELQAMDSDPDVAQALRQHPWLAAVLPVLLEASTDGSPPPPPPRG
jgi:hypothetical protein